MDDIFCIGLIVCAYFSALRAEKRIKYGLTMKKRGRIYHRIPIMLYSKYREEVEKYIQACFREHHAACGRL